MNVFCVFLLESPHRGDSYENTQYTISNTKKIISLNYPKSASMGFFSNELKNEFERAVVNEPPVFESLKVDSKMKIEDGTYTTTKARIQIICKPNNFIDHMLVEKLRQQSIAAEHKYYAKILKYVHLSFHETIILKQKISQQTSIEIEIRLHNIRTFLIK